MNRSTLAFALSGLCAVGCGGVADTNTQNANRAAAASPSAAAASPTNDAARRPDASPQQQAPDPALRDVTGGYFAASSLPAEFSEIEHLSLATIDDTGNPAPLNGFIRPKRRSAEDYRLVNPKIAGRELTFTTASVGGVSYSFAGRFEKTGNFPENPPADDEAVLRGTLTKLRDGKVVAETPVDFNYQAGG